MTIKIVIVEKTGALKEQSLKEFKTSELYKKAALKSGDGFVHQHSWVVQNHTFELYAKTEGRAGQENKYDFPPPVDTELFFGSCVLVKKREGDVCDLTITEWEKTYEHLFGGFEDLGSSDSEDDDDEEDDDMIPKTKEGYKKDGFVVDDDEEDEDDPDVSEEEDLDEGDDEEDYSEDEIVVKKKTLKKKNKVPKKPSKKQQETVFIMKSTDDVYLDCTSELSEESYV